MYIVLLFILLLGQTHAASTSLQLLTNTEQVIDSSNHFGHNCEEDHSTKTNLISIFIPFKNFFLSNMSINTIIGIPLILLEPPK
jgi:hypothetical protein